VSPFADDVDALFGSAGLAVDQDLAGPARPDRTAMDSRAAAASLRPSARPRERKFVAGRRNLVLSTQPSPVPAPPRNAPFAAAERPQAGGKGNAP